MRADHRFPHRAARSERKARGVLSWTQLNFWQRARGGGHSAMVSGAPKGGCDATPWSRTPSPAHASQAKSEPSPSFSAPYRGNRMSARHFRTFSSPPPHPLPIVHSPSHYRSTPNPNRRTNMLSFCCVFCGRASGRQAEGLAGALELGAEGQVVLVDWGQFGGRWGELLVCQASQDRFNDLFA